MKDLTVKILALLTLTLSLLTLTVQANETEINALLQFIKATSCQYERNGDFYSGVEAAKHVQKKYNYYQDDIKTTEDFIRYSATKSMMSGKKYLIHCQGKTSITSEQWLLTELVRIRTQHSAPE